MIPVTRFNSTELPSTHRFDFFREELWRARNGMDVELPREQPDYHCLHLGFPSLHLQQVSMPAGTLLRSQAQAESHDPILAMVVWQQGVARCECRQQSVEVKPASPLLLSSQFESRTHAPNSPFICLGVSHQALSAWLPSQQIAPVLSGVQSASFQLLSSLLNHLLAEAETLSKMNAEEISLLERQIIEWLSLVVSESQRTLPDSLRATQRRARYLEVLAKIEHWLHEPGLTVETLALRLGMSRRGLQLLFAEQGQSCRHYLRTQRLKRAEQWFKSGCSLSVTEVAFGVGFADVSHFSRCFRSQFGCSPSEIRDSYSV